MDGKPINTEFCEKSKDLVTSAFSFLIQITGWISLLHLSRQSLKVHAAVSYYPFGLPSRETYPNPTQYSLNDTSGFGPQTLPFYSSVQKLLVSL